MSLFINKSKIFVCIILCILSNILFAMDINTTQLYTPTSKVFDVVPNGEPATILTMKEVNKIIVQVNAISGYMPREYKLGSCSSTGCPVDSVQCDAVTESPFCPDGSTLNTTRDMCQKDPDVFNCPTGFTYDKTVNQCVKPLVCPNGGEYVVARNRCETPIVYECPAGYTQSGDICVAPPICPNGATFNSTTLKCEVDPTFACADAGWTYDSSVNKCWIAPTCPTGYAYNSTYDVCLLSYTASCPTGYTLNTTRNRCEKTPDCPSGTTYNVSTNRCEQGSNSACSGGTWNGTNCTVGSNYAAISNNIYTSCSITSGGGLAIYGTAGGLAYQVGVGATGLSFDINCKYGALLPQQSRTLMGMVFTNTSTSTATYTCPNGGTLSGTTCINQTTVAPYCPTGYTHDGSGQCYANPTCPSSGSFDGTNDVCYVPISKDCPNGSTYDVATDKCLTSYTPTCVTGYTYNSTRSRCEKTPPDCPNGTTYNATTNRCEQGTGSACTLTGGTWNGTSCTVGSNYAATGVYTREPASGEYFDPSNPIHGWLEASGDFIGYVLPVWNNISMDFYQYPTPKSFVNGGYTYYRGSFKYSDYMGNNYGIYRIKNTPDYTCPNGGTLSGTTCNTTSTVAPSCPTGYTHDGSGQCYANPTCPSSGSFDGTNDVCYLAFTKGCATGTLLAGLDICVQDAVCAKGILNKTRDRCEQDYQPVCGTGWTFNSTTQMCEKDPFCVVGTYSKTYDKCLLAYTPTCATGYTYNLTRSRCEKTPPDCPSGTTYNATTNRCEQGSGSACNVSYSQHTINSNYNLDYNQSINLCVGSKTNDEFSYTGPSLTVYGDSRGGGCGNTTYTSTYAWPKGISSSNYGKSVPRSNYYLDGHYFGNLPSPDQALPTVATAIQYVSSHYGYTNGQYVSIVSNWGLGGSHGTCSGNYGSNFSFLMHNCPSGYVLDSKNSCVSSALSCPTGTNENNGKCITSPSCPTGYTHDGSGQCYANPTCPSSGSYDGDLDMCWLAFGKSCTLGTYDSTSNACLNDPICDGGTLNTTLDKCQISRDIVCAQGVKNLTTGKCIFTASCQDSGVLSGSQCTEEAIPLTCPNGTDTTLKICYSNQDACKVDSSYPKASTLSYSKPLSTCIVDENVVCASSLTWSESYQKCEAVPICYNGMYNPENDFCYISTKECPINAAYPCKGPIGNQWCSPYECNPNTNQCGYAKCNTAYPPTKTEEPSDLIIGLIPNSTDSICKDMTCYFSNSTRVSYCGSEQACPKGFGVYQVGTNCFKEECPISSQEMNGKCYELK